ncbi:MAG: hypothetical protein ACKV2T_37320 [Kofleriaceae bacterium]
MYALPFLLIWKLHQVALDARRKNRRGAYLAWSAVAAFTWTLIVTAGSLLVYLFFYVGLWWLALIVGGVILTPMLGPMLIRRVFVPLGAYRLAYFVGYAARPGKDPVAYGLACSGWALGADPTGVGEVWIGKRRDARRPLGDAEVVVTAFVAAARGDATTARTLLRSVVLLVEDHPSVRELAGEWLACDAVSRALADEGSLGSVSRAWTELADDAREARYPATPLTWFLEGVAARRTGAEGAPTMRELYARWLLAPKRRVTRPLLAIAAARAPERSQPPANTATDVERPPLPSAIAAHLAIGTGHPTPEAFGHTVRAWDAALADGPTLGWLARRALELDAPLGAVDRVLRDVTAAVANDLARIAEGAQLGAPSSQGAIGDALGRHLRHGRLDALEDGFTRWANRRTDGELHAPIDEWREFIALKVAYTAAVDAGGLELRRLAFPHAFSTGSNMAAWLWNQRQEYALSHAISKWLLAEALAVGDTEAIELGHRNCALYVPTRDGTPEKTNSQS